MKHFIVAGILVAVVTALLIAGLGWVKLLPDASSAQAAPIDSLFDLEFKIIAFLFALIIVFMLYSIVVFRRKAGDTTDAKHITGNTKLEVLWTLAPLGVVLYLAYLGGQSLAETQRVDPQAIEVEVIGSQWSWRFEYPELGITSNEMVLPVNQQVLLRLRSTDVIHSFWVPEFRVKQDALPGGDDFVRELRITPIEQGEYKVRCAELCGLQHAYMVSPVKVVSHDAYNSWVISQSGLSADPVERGRKWYTDFACNSCHTIDGTPGVGPTWKALFNHQVTLDDGTVITVDEPYLMKSIRNPEAQIVQGFANIMPVNAAGDLTDAQVLDIIEFIKSIE
jgi:cytochrome c oxidase subunit 2